MRSDLLFIQYPVFHSVKATERIHIYVILILTCTYI